MMKKGISPIIAAVILIAIVVAIAGVASTFFSGFFKGRASEVEEKGAQAVDCSVGNFAIDPETTTTSSVTVHVKGKTGLSQWTYTVYNDTETFSNSTPPNKITPGGTVTLDISGHGLTNVYRIRVSTQECPNLESVANQTASGNWELIYQ